MKPRIWKGEDYDSDPEPQVLNFMYLCWRRYLLLRFRAPVILGAPAAQNNDEKGSWLIKGKDGEWKIVWKGNTLGSVEAEGEEESSSGGVGKELLPWKRQLRSGKRKRTPIVPKPPTRNTATHMMAPTPRRFIPSPYTHHPHRLGGWDGGY